MAKKQQLTAEDVRTNLNQVFEDFGGPTQVAAACLVTYGAAMAWKKRGNLNGTKVDTAMRFAKLAGQPIENFLVPS